MSIRTIFVNLPVADLEKSVAFFQGLGFPFDPQFTNESATRMVVNENASVMLLTRERFADFTHKRIVDAGEAIEVLIALAADSRDAVDHLADSAITAGGTEHREPEDHGFMYQRSFADLDGHVWEVLWMDMSQVPDSPTSYGTPADDPAGVQSRA